MTGEEKRRRLKEQIKAEYKQELKTRKDMLESAKRMRHTAKMNQAIQGLTDGLNDDSDEWIDRLNRESALTEAKMEMSLDGALDGDGVDKLEKLAKEAEAEKFSALQMVEQMKREMGILEEEEDTSLKDILKEEVKKPTPKSKGDNKKMGDF